MEFQTAADLLKTGEEDYHGGFLPAATQGARKVLSTPVALSTTERCSATECGPTSKKVVHSKSFHPPEDATPRGQSVPQAVNALSSDARERMERNKKAAMDQLARRKAAKIAASNASSAAGIQGGAQAPSSLTSSAQLPSDTLANQPVVRGAAGVEQSVMLNFYMMPSISADHTKLRQMLMQHAQEVAAQDADILVCFPPSARERGYPANSVRIRHSEMLPLCELPESEVPAALHQLWNHTKGQAAKEAAAANAAKERVTVVRPPQSAIVGVVGWNTASVISAQSNPIDHKPKKRAAATRTMRIKPEYVTAITSGSKTVEGRLFRGAAADTVAGDTLILKATSHMSVQCLVLEATRFGSFEHMLQACGLQHCLPGCSSMAEGVTLYRSFPDYEQLEARHGVIAFKIQPVSQQPKQQQKAAPTADKNEEPPDEIDFWEQFQQSEEPPEPSVVAGSSEREIQPRSAALANNASGINRSINGPACVESIADDNADVHACLVKCVKAEDVTQTANLPAGKRVAPAEDIIQPVSKQARLSFSRAPLLDMPAAKRNWQQSGEREPKKRKVDGASGGQSVLNMQPAATGAASAANYSALFSQSASPATDASMQSQIDRGGEGWYQTPCNHSIRFKAVLQNDKKKRPQDCHRGKQAGKWQLRVEGPQVLAGIASGLWKAKVKCLYSTPTIEAARKAVADFLTISTAHVVPRGTPMGAFVAAAVKPESVPVAVNAEGVPLHVQVSSLSKQSFSRQSEQQQTKQCGPMDAALAKAAATPNAEQARAIDAIVKRRESAFITGAAGTGKSYILKLIHKMLSGKLGANTVHVTAPTGIAAFHIGGGTIHSFSGVGLAEGPHEQIVQRVMANKNLVSKWQDAECLIIDEISMMDADFFELLNEVAQATRGNHQDFGGLQFVLCGDFFQLGPVKAKGPLEYAFESPLWGRAVKNHIHLTEVVRQQGDQQMVKLLQEIRWGECPPSSTILLHQCRRKLSVENGVLPTKLYTTNKSVDTENNRELAKLPGESHTFCADEKGNNRQLEALDKGCPAPKVLELKMGAQVVLLKNLSKQLVNGSRGVVTGWGEGGVPVVTFNNGFTGEVQPSTWDVKVKDSKASRTQIPLKLAWALTIHRAQGMTLDKCICVLDNVFANGQAYVALSRVTSLAGLELRQFDARSVRASEKVKKFYKNFT